MSDHEIPEEITRRLRPLGDTPAPDASPALAAFLADPVAPLTEKGDLSATAASNVNGPVAAAAAQAAGLPKRRRDMKQVLGEVLGAVARLGLVGKVALGAGAIALAGTGTAAAVNAVVEDEPPAPGVVQTVNGPDDDVTSEPVDDPTEPVDDDVDEPDDDQGDDSDEPDSDGDDDQGDDSDEPDSDGDDDQGDDSDGDDSDGDDDQGDDSDGDDDRDSDDRDSDDRDSDDDSDGDDDRDSDDDSDGDDDRDSEDDSDEPEDD